MPDTRHGTARTAAASGSMAVTVRDTGASRCASSPSPQPTSSTSPARSAAIRQPVVIRGVVIPVAGLGGGPPVRGDRRQQRAGVLVLGSAKVSGGPIFDPLAGAHHQHIVAQPLDDRQIVPDEQDRSTRDRAAVRAADPAPGPAPTHPATRWPHRGSASSGCGGQRPGDVHPLTLPAGQLVQAAGCERRRQADGIRGARRLRGPLRAVRRPSRCDRAVRRSKPAPACADSARTNGSCITRLIRCRSAFALRAAAHSAHRCRPATALPGLGYRPGR